MTSNKSFYRVLKLVFVLTFLLSLTTYAQTTNTEDEKKLFDLGNEVLQTIQNKEQKNEQEQTQISDITAKKPGVIRFGVVSAGGETASDIHSLAATVKLLELLDGSDFAPYDTVLLEAKMPHFISLEASKKQCDYVLYIEDVTHKKKKNAWNVMKGSIGRIIPNIPGIVPSDQYWKVYRSGQKVMNASELMTAVAGNTKAKDTTTISYRLVSIHNKSDLIPSTEIEKKATKDGENILESLVIKIGEEVLTKTAKQ